MQLNHPLITKLGGNETDRQALLAIKDQIQHDPNRVTSSWNETLHFCMWHGVTCSRRHRQRVTKLELDSLELEGSISPHMGNLSFLRVINLQNNSFTHLIPPEIGEIPPSLGNLSSLEKFIVTGNNLEGSVPSPLCQLKKLTSFSVGINRLSGIISSCIYNLSGIVIFEVLENQFQGSLPSNLGNAFPNLEILSISYNHFTGAIPWSISNATNLAWLQCMENKLTGQVPNLRNLHNLEFFTVSANNLGSGKHGDLSFVSELINATQLTLLEFSYNKFGGTFPTSISNLSTNLMSLLIGGNYLHGSIPGGLGNLVNLQVLGMEQNNFKGSIPTDIGKLPSLGTIYFSLNKFSGSIPSSFGNLTLLNILYLYGNNFSGSIPSRLGGCRMLQVLDLSQNSLDVEIGKMKALGQLEISNNMLSGELPSSIGSCQSLELLHLQGNFFNGHIPSSMQELKGVRDIDLSRNNFTGDIPHFLENLNLLHLNLSFNQVWGALPTGGVFENASAISVAGNAGLCGGMASLQLPLCKLNESKGEGLSRRMKLMISLVSGFTLLGLAVVLSVFLLRKKRKETKLSALGNSGLQVSYATLLKATEGFSSANLIGVGAFGSVYKGILSDDKVVVAVKVLNMLHRGASKSFMAECSCLRVHGEWELGGVVASTNGTEEVTEARKVLSLKKRLDIAIDVASALEYLHNHCETPIVHCDLKPSNVLLDNDLTGHVSDFGLSRFLGETTASVSGNQSSSIGIRGSVGYAAPEYGMGSEVSTYGDVYSFGILLLEMFTGKGPTDHMFSDGLNLHNYVKTALPKLVLEISESLLLQEGATNVTQAYKHNRLSVTAQKMEECLTLILGIGIACSVESPHKQKGYQ
ncbi:hypothetical protein ACLB2K_072067 [Fragaria x ananassa]